MRMRFLLKATSLCLALGGVAGITGCDNIDAGRLPEDTAPPKLVRVLFQDDTIVGGRGLATDLLDTSTGQACSDTNPCVSPYVCGERNGEPLGDGKCHNHNSTLEVPPPIGNPVGAAGLQIRLVFSKIIDPSIEKVFMKQCAKSAVGCQTDTDCDMSKDPTNTCSVERGPGRAAYTYAINPPDLVTLLGPGDKAIKATVAYAPGGSPVETSDKIFNPHGPAITVTPAVPLAPDTSYKLVVKAGLIKDRKGQQLADAKGTSLGETTTIEFKTEGLFVMQNWNCPSFNCIGYNGATINWPETSTPNDEQEIAPNHFINLHFNADIDETTADKITVKGPSGDVKYAAFNNRDDPEDCEGTQDWRSLNIVAVDDMGKATKWAPGSYTVTITGVAADGNSSATVAPLTLKIKVRDKDADPKSEDPMESTFVLDNLVMPSDCAM